MLLKDMLGYKNNNWKQKLATTAILLFCCICVSAQKIALETGYKYVNGSNLQLGVSKRFVLVNQYNPMNINAAFITDFSQNKLISVGVQQRFKRDFEAGLNISNQYIEPVVGINFLNMAKLNIGYAGQEDDKYKNMMGTASLNFKPSKKCMGL